MESEQSLVERFQTIGSGGAVSVDVAAVDGTAEAGTDYTGLNTTVTFGDSESSQTITVGVIDNNSDDGDRSLTVSLSHSTNGATLGAIQSTTVTILDDDESSGSDGDGGGGAFNPIELLLLEFVGLLFAGSRRSGQAKINYSHQGG